MSRRALARWALSCGAMLAADRAFAAAPPAGQNTSLRAMTFNVRYPSDDGEHSWLDRQRSFIDTLAAADADVIGTQELFKLQGDAVVTALPHYRWIGIDRRGGHDDEHMGIFYHVGRLALLQYGQFWLSDHPLQPGSIDWGHPLPRMAAWALFQRLSDARRFYLVNTHLPYRAQDGAARAEGAQLIARWIAQLPPAIPVVLTGDFNTSPDSRPHAILSATMRDAWDSAGTRVGPAGTFHGFSGTIGDRIDWIFLRGLTARIAATLIPAAGQRYPSDHFPVLCELEW